MEQASTIEQGKLKEMDRWNKHRTRTAAMIETVIFKEGIAVALGSIFFHTEVKLGKDEISTTNTILHSLL